MTFPVFCSETECSHLPPPFFLVAIEWETEQGLLNTQDSNPGAFIFLREGEDSNRQIRQATNSELLEKEDNLDSEAKHLLRNLKAKIASHYPEHLKVHTLAYSARRVINT